MVLVPCNAYMMLYISLYREKIADMISMVKFSKRNNSVKM